MDCGAIVWWLPGQGLFATPPNLYSGLWPSAFSDESWGAPCQEAQRGCRLLSRFPYQLLFILHVLPTCHSPRESQHAPAGLFRWKALGARRQEIWVPHWALAHPLWDPDTFHLLSHPRSCHLKIGVTLDSQCSDLDYVPNPFEGGHASCGC